MTLEWLVMAQAAFRIHAPDWIPNIDVAQRIVKSVDNKQHFGRVVFQQGEACGWLGLIKDWYVWEIHPIAISQEHQNGGLGRLLVEDAASIAKRAGALTLFAGTSDSTGETNIFDVDLYDDPVRAINHLEATRRGPLEFWRSVGFTVVGVMPDAEGAGKPGIHLARRLN